MPTFESNPTAPNDDVETPEAAPADFDRFLADLDRLDAQYADISRRAEALGLGAVYRLGAAHTPVHAPGRPTLPPSPAPTAPATGGPKPDQLLDAIESLRAELRAVITPSVDMIAAELVSPPDLNRPRLRAMLLHAADHVLYRKRVRDGVPVQPTLAECQALADAHETLWTLDGALTPAAAIVLRCATQSTSDGLRPDPESLRDLATWLGLLPAAAPSADPAPEAP